MMSRRGRYLRRVAHDIARLQRLCFAEGLNFYVETHVARVSEDTEAFAKIMQFCPSYFEVSWPFSSWNRSILIEIYLCHACFCQAILRTKTAGQVNVDISHFGYRNIVRGRYYQQIMDRAGHTHQRMARVRSHALFAQSSSAWRRRG
jgi:hypothetical protein